MAFTGRAQCPSPSGDEASYGNESWIGYVYSARENFSSSFYVGFITQTETFNQTFSDDSLYTSDCATELETFTIRYKMRKTFSCGEYQFTIGGDDGVRLSLDGGSTWLIDGWQAQPYTTYSTVTFLDSGSYDLVFEYYEAYGQQRVSFSYAQTGTGATGGQIAGDQSYCPSAPIDPSAFSSESTGGFCSSSGSVTYFWQKSADNVHYNYISGATGLTYDPPAGFPTDTLVYYRRVATLGTDTAYSNVVSIQTEYNPGDESLFGTSGWIGHVYNGMDNFLSADYLGTLSESERFDQNFGGNNTTISIDGCDTETHTFTVRYKMQMTFDHGVYQFTIGGDDGVRLSLDGGATYLIEDWGNHGYRTRTATDTLNGTYDMVFDYYENGGGNRVSFDYLQQTPLPVDLLDFTATYTEENEVKLVWITASEINNDYFTIERSPNAETYQVVEKVKGAGTTNVKQVYEATDETPCEGLCYYRLTQTDLDGKETRYAPVLVEAQTQGKFAEEDVIVFPNPLSGNQLTIKLNGISEEETDIFINDLYGKQYVSDITFINLQDHSLIILEFFEKLPKGVYLINVTIRNRLITKKVLVR